MDQRTPCVEEMLPRVSTGKSSTNVLRFLENSTFHLAAVGDASVESAQSLTCACLQRE